MNKINKAIILIVLSVFLIELTVDAQQHAANQKTPEMFFGDTTRLGVPFAKDPHVIRFKGRYLMYYSVPGFTDKAGKLYGWGIGIAESKDLNNWKRIADVNVDPDAIYEAKGFAAPCALVIGDKVHLFYQTYGNGMKDAICHAWSTDGIRFTRNQTNPIFSPDGVWNCGRAIDAEVISFKGQYFLYYATRDPDFKIQMLGVAVAAGNTNFNREDWINLSKDQPVLKPQFPWEETCTEGASVVEMNQCLFMFYAGAYNNRPQQIGVAKSSDGIKWERLSNKPFLENGEPGTWNSCESGHPHLFKDENGKTYLFFQGNNDFGKTWHISNMKMYWRNEMPFIKK